MLESTDRARLEFCLKMILVCKEIIERHGSIDLAIEDIEGQNAVMMCILQIGEKLSKLQSLELRSILPVKESYAVRNIIAHNYDNIDLTILSEILETDLPDLKVKIDSILK
jgi:uncharacterized protein with HEPN domain